MEYLHLYEDENGISHFADRVIALSDQSFAPPAPSLLLSAGEAAVNLVHLILPVGWGGAQHRSPKRQIAYCLSGQLKVVAGDGEERLISAGGIWKMEDTQGEGHKTTVLGQEDVRLAIVQYE